MITVTILVAISAFVTAVLAGTRPDWFPLWVSVVLVSIGLLLITIPK